MSEHIRALHAGRKAFAEVQCDEQTRRALRHKVRSVEKRFDQGSKVYFKRDGQDRWRGPATVIGNDGSVYFLRQQGTIYRVSACRIIDVEHSNSNESSGQVEENPSDSKDKDGEVEGTASNKNESKVNNIVTTDSDLEDSSSISIPTCQESAPQPSCDVICPKVGVKIEYRAGKARRVVGMRTISM